MSGYGTRDGSFPENFVMATCELTVDSSEASGGTLRVSVERNPEAPAVVGRHSFGLGYLLALGDVMRFFVNNQLFSTAGDFVDPEEAGGLLAVVAYQEGFFADAASRAHNDRAEALAIGLVWLDSDAQCPLLKQAEEISLARLSEAFWEDVSYLTVCDSPLGFHESMSLNRFWMDMSENVTRVRKEGDSDVLLEERLRLMREQKSYFLMRFSLLEERGCADDLTDEELLDEWI